MNKEGRNIITWVWLLVIMLPGTLFSQKTPDETSRRLKQASAYYRSGAYERAIPLLKTILKTNPRHRGAFQKLLNIYERMRQADSIQVLCHRFDQHSSLTFNDQMAIAAAFIIQDKQSDALAHIELQIQKLREKNRLTPQDIQRAAYLLQRYRMADEAAEYFKKGIRYFPEAHFFYTAIADIYKQQMKYAAATKEYLNFLVAHPNGLKVAGSRIMSMKIPPQQRKEIANTIHTFMKDHPGNMDLIQLYVEFEINSGHYEKALKVAKDKLPTEKRLTIMIQIAGEMGENKTLNAAIALLEKEMSAFEEDNRVQIKLKLIELYAAQFNGTQAVMWLEKMDQLLEEVKNKGNASFWNLKFKQLTVLLENRYNINNCISLAEELLKNTKKKPQRNRLYLYLGKAYRWVNDMRNSSVNYAKVLPYKQDHLNAGYELLMNDFYTFQWDSLSVGIKRLTKGMALEDTLANNFLRLKQYLAFNYPDEESRRLFAAALLKTEQRAYSEAYTMINAVIEKSEGYFKSYCTILSADLASRMGLLTQAVNIYNRILSDASMVERHEDALFFLAGVYENLNDIQKAETLYFELLEKFPAGRFAEAARKHLNANEEN